MLSVIIPAYKEPYLQKTIDNILENSEGEIEVIPVLDAYWPDPPLKEDKRVRIVHIGKQKGMRNAINCGVNIARGDLLMRTDAHCVFGKGFDRIIAETIEDNWILTPRRYFLDPVKWEVMDLPYVDYEKLVIQDGKKFSGQPWSSRTKERAHIMIDETMAFQGSVWFMKKSWWEKVVVRLEDENYGTHIQDSHEMHFKGWKAGGKVMINKNTWFAHKHREFPRTHNYGSAESAQGWAYALKTWKEYYEKEIRPKWGI